MEKAQVGPVAFVFGRESRGLTNDELKLCTHHLIIPTDREFASLNVAHAAAIVAYEIFKVACRPVGYQVRDFRPASIDTREKMYEQMERVLIQAGFLDASNPLRMMREIRRIFNSAKMDERDVTIVRGIFRKIGNLVRLNQQKSVHRARQGGSL
jgi:TrmH family RNA methyltransferase